VCHGTACLRRLKEKRAYKILETWQDQILKIFLELKLLIAFQKKIGNLAGHSLHFLRTSYDQF
jgi:hypothetical protein